MFKKLRDRIKNWTKRVSEEETEEIEETKEEAPEEEKPKKKTEKKEKSSEKKPKQDKKTKKEKQKSKEEEKSEKKQKESENIEKEIEEAHKKIEKTNKEKQSEDEKEVPVPKKFDVAKQKYEPDLEKIKEPPKKDQEETEKKGFFKKLTSKRKISEEDFEDYSEELEMTLLENNVAVEVSEKIIDSLKQEIVGKEIPKKELQDRIYSKLEESIKEILVEPFNVEEKIKQKSKPYVILFCGINGTGKTTSIAKFSKYLEKKGLSSVLASGDTFRAASIEQLKEHGEKLDKKVISGSYGSDPASIGYDAIKYAEKNNIDAVLIDTAGRMYTNKNLMQEMEKISRVCQPDLKLFVGESTTGNDALEQAKSFNESVGIDGIILSKADIDEKGGTALSVGYITGKPILYLGTGQNYEDLEAFDKEKFVDKLFEEE